MKAGKRTQRPRKEKTKVVPETVPGTPWWVYASLFAVALVALLSAYGPALKGPFVFDDQALPFLAPNSGAHSLASWLLGVRPVLMASYWVSYQSGGAEPYGYKLVNLFIHLLNGVLIWLIVRKVLEFASETSPLRTVLSVFCAFLFLLHPVQTESVAYAAGRSETLSVFFAFAAIALFVYRRSITVTWAVSAGLFVLMCLAILTKEHTAVIPGVLLLTDYFWNPGFSFEGVRRNWRFYTAAVILGIAGGAFICFRVLSSALTAGFRVPGLPWYDYFFSECRAVWSYLRLVVIPIGQNVDYDFPVSHGILARGAIVGLGALVAVSVAAWIYRKRFPLAAYGWFVFLLLLAPTSSFLPIADLFVERRLYLPFLGILLICCEFLRRSKMRVPALAAVLGAVIVVYGIAAHTRSQVWTSNLALWQDTVKKSPGKARPHQYLANAYVHLGRYGPAAEEYAKAAKVQTPTWPVYYDWAVSLDFMGRDQEALEKLKLAVALQPGGIVYAELGRVFGKLGRPGEAFAALQKAEALAPTFEDTYVYRGNLYLWLQEYDLAEQQYRKALSINASNPSAIRGVNLARRRSPAT